MNDSHCAVVVTGVGAITPFGVGAEPLWQGLREGRSAISELSFDGHNLPCRSAGQIQFDTSPLLSRVEARRMPRFSQYALIAAREAVEDAGLASAATDKSRTAVVVGNGSGAFASSDDMSEAWHKRGWKGLDPLGLVKALPDTAAAQLSIALGTKGPILTCVAACVSSHLAIGYAADLIRHGRVTTAIAVGTEAWLTPLGIASFCALQALSTRDCSPGQASCPFDRKRDGFVPGEGAAALILETQESAMRRGATVLAEVAGFASNADAHNMLAPSPDGESAATCVQLALDDAGVEVEDLSWVSAHGTSTPLNDVIETKAIKKALGDHAYSVPVSSLKSMIGHTLGAAGAIESVASVLSIRDSVIPPTINLNDPDPECDLDYVSEGKRSSSVRVVLKTGFAFGGQNACLVFRSPGSRPVNQT